MLHLFFGRTHVCHPENLKYVSAPWLPGASRMLPFLVSVGLYDSWTNVFFAEMPKFGNAPHILMSILHAPQALGS